MPKISQINIQMNTCINISGLCLRYLSQLSISLLSYIYLLVDLATWILLLLLWSFPSNPTSLITQLFLHLFYLFFVLNILFYCLIFLFTRFIASFIISYQDYSRWMGSCFVGSMFGSYDGYFGICRLVVWGLWHC